MRLIKYTLNYLIFRMRIETKFIYTTCTCTHNIQGRSTVSRLKM